MDITVHEDWQWVGNSFEVAFATTSDPRVLAIIQREDEFGGNPIDGDAYAPAFYFDNVITEAGSTFMDDESRHIAQRFREARRHFVNWHYRNAGQRRQMDYDTVAARYLRIFHDTVVAHADSSLQPGLRAWIFSTPTWREHVGGVGPDPLREDALAGDIEAWEAALGGDIFGVGWATNVGRVMDDGETPDPTDAPWTMSIECWGFLGEEHAKREALQFWDYGEEPHLEPLLDFDEPGFVEHTDRLADAS
ncbi:hypothetical protein SEA_SADLAD_87 [Microbacterium phage SadLad]|nr:hypothetical protein SEA_SADLAD_87 [Microbacterium phage SadLad]